MPQTRNLDPSRFVLTVHGVPIVMPAADTFYEFTYEADQVSDEVGGQGDVVRIITRDMRATLKITLMQTSPSNDYLSSRVVQDLNANGPASTGGYAVGTSSLVDLNGTTAIDGEETWVMKFADAGFGSKPNTRVWSIRFARAVANIGGNVV
jgi:hypothetical protein